MTPSIACPPLTDAEWPAEIADMQSGFAGGLNVYRTMARNPALLRALTDLREHLVNQSTLGPERREVVVLRTAFRLRSGYEWKHHVVRSRSCGLEDKRILSLRGDVGAMTPQDGILAQAVDELFARSRLSPATAVALSELVGIDGALDVLATVGFYSTLGFVLNTADTPLDDDVAAQLAAAPLSGDDKQGAAGMAEPQQRGNQS